MTTESCNPTHNTVDYTHFLPRISAIILTKKKDSEQQTESEFKQTVNISYRDAVTKVMRDLLAYTIDISIDFYEGVRDYEIIPPDGYHVEDVIGVYSNNADVTAYNYTTDTLTISCCPDYSVDSAVYVKVAIVPSKLGGICEFDSKFVDKYYDLILDAMLSDLLSMINRQWVSLEQSRLYQERYLQSINKERHKIFSANALSAKGQLTSDYNLFLPALSTMVDYKSADSGLSQVEYRQIVSNLFQDAVKTVMKDTKLYREQFSIDVYEGCKIYEFDIPHEYTVEDVISIKPANAKLPEHSYNLQYLNLSCCPESDVDKAYIVDLALNIKSGLYIYKIDSDFLNENYDLILYQMRHQMYAMKSKSWADDNASLQALAQYNSMVEDKINQVIITDSLLDRASNHTDYNLFLPKITASIYDSSEKMTQAQFNQIIDMVYKEACQNVMRDSLFNRKIFPIDLYDGVKNYPIPTIDGYRVGDIIKMMDGEIKTPCLNHDETNIYLKHCPKRDIQKAFYIEVSLVQLSNSNSHTIPHDFIDKYYDLILNKMWQLLYSMAKKYWYNPSQAGFYAKQYKYMIRKEKRFLLTGGAKIKINTKRLSDNA